MSNHSYDGLDFERPIIELEQRIKELEKFTKNEDMDCSEEVILLREKLRKLTQDIFSRLTPWQRVQLSRHPRRPYTRDYIGIIFDDFIELHGDRKFGDDKAMVCGLAKIENQTFVVIGHQKGREIKEKISCNFGCANPEGYRKALRIMQLAEKFGFPIITFIDTPGAYPGIGAEERGQSEAIAFNIMRMFEISVPIIAFIIGEGGSGGALGIGVADVLAILENAYYSVISPEGCSAILWKDKTKVADAAAVLKITAKDLIEMGIVDEIIEEPLGGAHREAHLTADNIKQAIFKYTNIFCNMTKHDILERRYNKYRKIGKVTEEN